MTAESRHVSPHYLFAVLNFNGGFGPKDMPGYSLGQLVQRISVHFRLYLASRQENVLCIYLNLNNAFGLKVFDSSNSQEYPITSPEDEFGIRKGLTGLAEEIPEHSAGNGLSACLSLLLCEFNRYRQTSPRLTSSVLILNQCIVPSSQYITFLNATFQAQNSKIRVDAVDMNGSDSVLLRQATAITGGLYITVKHINEILPSLLSFNLQDSSGAATLSLPLQTNVDFRGSCFCHGKIVDVGYVCSVCLSGILALSLTSPANSVYCSILCV
jgi:transcription factor TFB4